jgi:aldehyde dehydrogenase (NAD+)
MDSEKQSILAAISENRSAVSSGLRISVARRKFLLKRLHALLVSHQQVVLDAIREDLGKSDYETLSTEFMPLVNIIKYLIRKINSLSAPHRVGVSLFNWPASGRIVAEPYGHVLIGATWNYPLLLAIEPLAGAIAAGNRVTIKLNPRAPRTMLFLRWLIEETFSGEVAAVSDELSWEDLLAEEFDYIFFTGSTAAGKRVLEAAAKFLTPVTLELGGKNPCIVAPGANIKSAARRIVWGKFTNCGQTCIAPDYLVVHESLKERLSLEIKNCIRKFYGETPLASSDYPHLIDSAAYERISSLVSGGRLIAGGDKEPAHHAVEPTVVDRLETDDPLLNEEIFGPVLPIITYNNDDSLMQEVLRRGKVLALYCFGGSAKLRKMLRDNTSSGALVFDDVVMHFVNDKMPFGGVGSSGIGAYHGKRTFTTFSHEKPVMYASRIFDMPLRYPPYSKWLTALLKRFAR